MAKHNLLRKVTIRINIVYAPYLENSIRALRKRDRDDLFPNINTFIISCINLDDKNRNYLCFHLISQLQVKINNLARSKAFHGKAAILRSKDCSQPVSKHCVSFKPKDASGSDTPDLLDLAPSSRPNSWLQYLSAECLCALHEHPRCFSFDSI